MGLYFCRKSILARWCSRLRPSFILYNLLIHSFYRNILYRNIYNKYKIRVSHFQAIAIYFNFKKKYFPTSLTSTFNWQIGLQVVYKHMVWRNRPHSLLLGQHMSRQWNMLVAYVEVVGNLYCLVKNKFLLLNICHNSEDNFRKKRIKNILFHTFRPNEQIKMLCCSISTNQCSIFLKIKNC